MCVCFRAALLMHIWALATLSTLQNPELLPRKGSFSPRSSRITPPNPQKDFPYNGPYQPGPLVGPPEPALAIAAGQEPARTMEAGDVQRRSGAIDDLYKELRQLENCQSRGAGASEATPELILLDEECVPICIKATHSPSRPAISNTLEAAHKGVPGEIKASQI